MSQHLSMSDAYDAFLFEPLWVEDSGMELSVLSALARAGLDPWAEAKRLAGLPRQAAIAAISAILPLADEPETARRLAELLPRSVAAQPTMSATLDGFDRERFFRRFGLLIILGFLAIAVAIMMYAAPTRSSGILGQVGGYLSAT